MSLEHISDDELLARADALIQKYTSLAPELATQLEKFGRLRNELQLLVVEIKARKLPFEHAQENSTE